jgi:hypothetical protein
MALTWDIEDTNPISLTDVIAIFEARGRHPLSGFDLSESASILRRLYNDRRSICEFIDRNYRNFLQFDRADYAPDAIVIHRGKHFLVRAVIWLPDGIKGQRSNVRDIRTHDHNFNFMTLGLLGPGYETEVWEYEYKTEKNLTGTDVPVHGHQLLRLGEKRVFYFRKSIDIHRQIPPRSFSVSLNIMELAEQANMQFEFADPIAEVTSHLKATCCLNPPLVQHLAAILRDAPFKADAENVLNRAQSECDVEFRQNILTPAQNTLRVSGGL